MADAVPYELVATLDDVPENDVLAVETTRGEKVCLINLAGTIHAVHDVCTHQEFPMSQGVVHPDGTIECAWHGARFDVRTGRVQRFPAEEALPVYDVRVEGGAIYVGGRK